MFFQILHKIFLYNCSQLNSGSVLAHTSKGTCFKICILHTKNARGRPLWQITTYTWKLWVLCFVVQCCASFERGCFPFKISLLSLPAPILAGVAELTFVSNRIALHSDLISFTNIRNGGYPLQFPRPKGTSLNIWRQPMFSWDSQGMSVLQGFIGARTVVRQLVCLDQQNIHMSVRDRGNNWIIEYINKDKSCIKTSHNDSYFYQVLELQNQ